MRPDRPAWASTGTVCPRGRPSSRVSQEFGRADPVAAPASRRRREDFCILKSRCAALRSQLLTRNSAPLSPHSSLALPRQRGGSRQALPGHDPASLARCRACRTSSRCEHLTGCRAAHGTSGPDGKILVRWKDPERHGNDWEPDLEPPATRPPTVHACGTVRADRLGRFGAVAGVDQGAVLSPPALFSSRWRALAAARLAARSAARASCARRRLPSFWRSSRSAVRKGNFGLPFRSTTRPYRSLARWGEHEHGTTATP
jgi:hypothetical protein